MFWVRVLGLKVYLGPIFSSEMPDLTIASFVPRSSPVMSPSTSQPWTSASSLLNLSRSRWPTPQGPNRERS